MDSAANRSGRALRPGRLLIEAAYQPLIAKASNTVIYTSYSSPIYRLLDAVFRRLWMLVVFTILSTAVVGLMVTFLLKGYTAKKVLLITPPEVANVVWDKRSKPVRVHDKAEAMDALIHTRTLLQEAAQRSNVYLGATPQEETATLHRIRDGLEVDLNTDSSFLVSLRWSTADEAEKMVDAIVDLYIRYMSQAQSADAITAVSFLSSQLDEYRGKMEVAEQDRRDFKEQNLQNMPEMQTNFVGKLNELDQQLVDARINGEEAKIRLQQLKQRLASVPKMIEAELTEGPNPLEGELTRLRTEEIRLLGLYTSEHPDVQVVREQIAVLEQHIKSRVGSVTERKMTINPTYASLDRQLQDAEVNLRTLNSREQALQAALRTYETRVKAIPRQEQKLAALDRDFTVFQTAFADLTDMLANARIQKELSLRRHQDMYMALDPAEAEPTLTPMKRIVLLAFGPLFGLFAALLLILVLEQWDRSFRSVSDLQAAIEVPVLAVMPNTPGMKQLTAGLASLSSGWAGAPNDNEGPPELSRDEEA